ncbi:MAG: hypothetical protein EXS10_06335 [Phycisphaerales bacterium]|nr:hypothetical protein [Phycisphaerales bacterium]
MKTTILFISLCCATPALAADLYDCTLAPSSNLVTTLSMDVPFTGTFIGNYDVVTLPTGTRTIPGFFGGSGNNPIPYTASFGVDGGTNTSPAGAFQISVEQVGKQLVGSISGLAIDALDGASGSADLALTINYTTFHTVAPNSIYPGGIPITLPFGTANVTVLTLAQVGAAPMVITSAKGGGYTFTAAVPVMITMAADAMGQPIDAPPTPGVLPLMGTLSFTGDTVHMNATTSQQSNGTQPSTAPPFVNQPIALPTVLPAGGTANLLMSGLITEVTSSQSTSGTLVVSGTRVIVCEGDLNHDGIVDAVDLSILLNGWDTASADLNGDGITNAQDLAILLNAWGAC